MRLRILAGILFGAAFIAGSAMADPLDQFLATPPGQLRAAFLHLPPEVQDKIREELKTESLDELMSYSPDELKAAIQGLSPETKAQLKAQWASLPPGQKAKLKSLDLKALWQEALARFAAMGPAEKALVKKLLGKVTADQAAP
jgi:hypothetical protein